jgi:hypothetical protein
MAWSRPAPHISGHGRSDAQTAGREPWPKIKHRSCASSWTHRIPAGLPPGMPGMAELIDGAMQHAPQAWRHSMGSLATPTP